MIEGAMLYIFGTLLFAGAAMIGCFVGHPPPFPVAARKRLALFGAVWALVTAVKLALDLTAGPVNVLIPIVIAAAGARLLLVKFSK